MKTILKTLAISKAIDFIRTTNGRFFSVSFIKKDGSTRNMTARLGVSKGIKGTGTYSHTGDSRRNNMTVWDAAKRNFRAVPLDRIIWIKIDGQEYAVVQIMSSICDETWVAVRAGKALWLDDDYRNKICYATECVDFELYWDSKIDWARCDTCGKVGRINSFESNIDDISNLHSLDEYQIIMSKSRGASRGRYTYTPLNENHYFCQKCLPAVLAFLPTLMDVCLLQTAVNKLKGAINERRKRNKDNGTIEVCTCKCCTERFERLNGLGTGERFAQVEQEHQRFALLRNKNKGVEC